MIFALRRGAQQHELRIVELGGHVRPFAFMTRPANPAPSLTQALDRYDLRGRVSRRASALVGHADTCSVSNRKPVISRASGGSFYGGARCNSRRPVVVDTAVGLKSHPCEI